MSGQTTIQDVIKGFTDSREKMLEALGEAQGIIGDELKSQEADLAARLGKGKTITILNYTGNAGKGGLTKRNDRELFHWNGVAVEDGEEKREYLIDLFYNEVDPKTYNFHSQIGRLQFAALQPVAPDERGESPHVKIDGHWRFMEDRLGESHQSLCDYGKDYPELKPFNPVELVKDFMGFVVKREA